MWFVLEFLFNYVVILLFLEIWSLFLLIIYTLVAYLFVKRFPQYGPGVAVCVSLLVTRNQYSVLALSSARMSNQSSVLGGKMRLNDGNEMPMIGLGISRINGQQSVNSSVQKALEAGYRLFDTAELYGNEAELGAALEEYMPKYGLQREDIFITTKVQTKDGNATSWAEEKHYGIVKKTSDHVSYTDSIVPGLVLLTTESCIGTQGFMCLCTNGYPVDCASMTVHLCMTRFCFYCRLLRAKMTMLCALQSNPCGSVERREEGEFVELLHQRYLDLVLLHFPRDRWTGSDDAHEVNKKGRREVWRVLEQFKDRGLVKSIGVSNYEIYHLVELFEYAKHKPAVDQLEFHPYFTRRTLIHFCMQNRIFVQGFSSLLWGNKEILNEPIVKKLAEKYDVTPQTILYAFPLRSGIGIIPKSVTAERIRDNIVKVAATQLTHDELKSLRELDRNAAFCPRCFPWRCL
ncbi:oxidoreductase, aldo/keto reductase family protein [Ostertagia ostertagi]